VKFPWRQAQGEVRATGSVRAAEPSAAGAQSCVSLRHALERILQKDKPEILDLGPLCGDTVIYLAGRGARVCVEEFEPPPPLPQAEAGRAPEEIAVEPVRIDQPSGRFDLVLAWERLDFVPPDRLSEFGAELARVLADPGWLLLFSVGGGAGAERDEVPCRYRLLADDRLVREPAPAPRRRRWTYPTRDIERALGPLSIHGIQLQRNQIREFLAWKKPRSGGRAARA
jgi:hypothetical protein